MHLQIIFILHSSDLFRNRSIAMDQYEYFIVKEINEHEGESWNYFLPYIKNTIPDKMFDLLGDILSKSENFKLMRYSVIQTDFDVLMKYNDLCDTTYQKCFNSTENLIITEEMLINFIRRFFDDEQLDELYKGGIFDAKIWSNEGICDHE